MVKLYVEGGGDAAALKTVCREGFSNFLKKAGFEGKMPRIVACGSRADAFDSFCTATKNDEAALLLVDSEELVKPIYQLGNNKEDRKNWLPWQHLKQRQGDGWDKPDKSVDTDCHLMVQCMESWFLADRQSLQEFFGQGYMESQLPAAANAVESVAKTEVYRSLANATRNCKTKAPYGKAEHSFKLLALVDPAKVTAASPWAQRLVDELKNKMGIV